MFDLYVLKGGGGEEVNTCTKVRLLRFSIPTVFSISIADRFVHILDLYASVQYTIQL